MEEYDALDIKVESEELSMEEQAMLMFIYYGMQNHWRK
jgi:hypothetical protein